MPDPDSKNVVVLTSTNVEHHLTLRLRVLLMQPYLEARNYKIDIVQIPRAKAGRRELFATLSGYDLVWIHRQTFHFYELRWVARISPNIVFDFDDPVGYSSSKFANFSLKRWLKFRATVRAAKAVLAASPGLVDLASRWNDNVHYIPLCAEPEKYSMCVTPRAADEPLRLLWIGGRSTFKYLEACRSALEAIGLACANVELVVVGHAELYLQHLKVTNLKWSVAVETEQLARCHVGLVPQSDDRWTRAKASLKPLQYLASGLPFIGNPVGVVKGFSQGGTNGFLASADQEWVSAVRKLAEDEALRIRMAQSGIDYVQRVHSADVLAPKVEAAFQTVLA